MIEILKLPVMSKDLKKHLTNINPWWEKRIKKLVKKLTIWMLHFNVQPQNYFTCSNYTNDNFDQLIKDLNQFLLFYNTKITAILQNGRVFKKMQKMMVNFAKLSGLVHSIYEMANYYQQLNQLDLPNESRQKLGIKLGNEKIVKTWTQFERKVEQKLSNKDITNQIFKKYEISDYKLFNPSEIILLINSHIRQLRKLEQMTEKKYLQIYYDCLIEISFLNQFIDNYSLFVTKI